MLREHRNQQFHVVVPRFSSPSIVNPFIPIAFVLLSVLLLEIPVHKHLASLIPLQASFPLSNFPARGCNPQRGACAVEEFSRSGLSAPARG